MSNNSEGATFGEGEAGIEPPAKFEDCTEDELADETLKNADRCWDGEDVLGFTIKVAVVVSVVGDNGSVVVAIMDVEG